MALDSELSRLRDDLFGLVENIDRLRSKLKHPNEHKTRSSTEPDRPAAGDSELCKGATEVLRSYLHEISKVVDTPDEGGVLHPEVGSGQPGDNGEAAAVQRNAADERDDGPPLTLGRDQMGGELARSLRVLCDSTGAIHGKIKCNGMPRIELGALGSRIPMPAKEAGVVLAVRYARQKGMVVLNVEEADSFRCPAPSGPVQRPSDQHVQQYIDSTLAHPPEATLAYYVGDELNDEFDGILEADDELRQLRGTGTEIKGVNTTYWLLGAAGSGTAAHCEDLNLRSCNITLEGYKWWVLVDVGSTNSFEEWARSLRWPCSKPEKDDQWVRRMNLIPTTATLVERGIGFSECVTGPGEMVTTAPRQYHWVINITDSLSLATNFTFDGELQQGLESLKSLPLAKNSPMWALRQDHIRNKTAGPAREDGGQPPPSRPGETPSDAGEPVNHSSTNPQAPTTQGVANCEPSNHKRSRPQREATKAVPAGAYYAPPPAKRQSRPRGKGDGNAPSGNQMQEQMAPSNTSQGLLPQTHRVHDVYDRWCDTEGLTGCDEYVFRVLLGLRGKCAVDRCSGILVAWKDGDCLPSDVISDYLDSNRFSQQPNIAALIRSSSKQGHLSSLLLHWGQLQAYRKLYKAFGHTNRFDDWDRIRIRNLLGDSDFNVRDARSWYNAGWWLDRISPGTLEGLAIFCLLPPRSRRLKDSFQSGTQADLKTISESAEKITQLQTLYKGHDYTRRLVQQTVDLISMIVSDTTLRRDPHTDRHINEALKVVDRETVLALLNPNSYLPAR